MFLEKRTFFKKRIIWRIQKIRFPSKSLIDAHTDFIRKLSTEAIMVFCCLYHLFKEEIETKSLLTLHM